MEAPKMPDYRDIVRAGCCLASLALLVGAFAGAFITWAVLR